MYKITKYENGETLYKNIKTEKEAKEIKHQLLQEKLKYDKDYTDYNWLLLVEKE